MEQSLRKEAEKKTSTKLAFYQCAIIFSGAIVVLLILSLYLPGAALWLRLPIPILLMVLGVVFVSTFGLPTAKGFSDNWREEEIERQMKQLRRRKNLELPPLEDLSETEILELKELDRLQQKWNPEKAEYV